MISQTAEYALRAIVCLADQKGAPRTTAFIAEATQTPAGYLAKVMQSLCRAGLTKSRRGLNGGFVLNKDPGEVTILAVVSAVDPIHRYPECPLGIASHGRTLCPLHKRLDQAAELVEQAFAQTTVAELLTAPRERKPACRFPIVSKAV
jgi:Rrf2 family transcriptional regulator, nitric oxide-sensitive transcriptional repressor